MSAASLRCMAAAMLLASASLAAEAATWQQLLKGTPFEMFNETDMKMFLEASHKALDVAPLNDIVIWSNPDTKAGGDLTAVSQFKGMVQSQERECKLVRVRVQAKGRNTNTNVNVCQIDGKWTLVPRSDLKKK